MKIPDNRSNKVKNNRGQECMSLWLPSSSLTLAGWLQLTSFPWQTMYQKFNKKMSNFGYEWRADPALGVTYITVKSAFLSVYKAHITYVIFWFYTSPYGLHPHSDFYFFSSIGIKKLRETTQMSNWYTVQSQWSKSLKIFLLFHGKGKIRVSVVTASKTIHRMLLDFTVLVPREVLLISSVLIPFHPSFLK